MQVLLRRISQIMAGILVVAVCVLAAQSDDVLFQAAIKKEVVDGDLAGAIEAYDALSRSGNQQIAAKALVRLGRCYEKLGDGRAAEVYARVVQDFAGQKDQAQDAAARLAVLRSVAANGNVVGWYNGDWQSGVPGLRNFYLSETESARVYDDFVVPPGGWTVMAVYSNNRMDFSGVTYAAWEIRRGVGSERAGTTVASGLSPASQTAIPGNGPFPRDPLVGYRIQVDGLQLRLPAGRYWLNVAPVGMGTSFISATLGRNAVGSPPGNNGRAFVRNSPGPESAPGMFVPAEQVGGRGQFGIGKDFSQGVVIMAPAPK